MKKLLSSLLALGLTLSLSLPTVSALELDEAKELLALHYVDGVPAEVLELDSLDDILEALGDPYTFYMTAEQYESFNQSVNGQVVVGIGATVETIFNGGYRVMSILPESPALEAGIRPGDLLVAVDGVELAADIDPRTYIVGEEGTPVTLTLLRDGQRLEFTLTRRAVTIPIVTYELADGVGYIDCLSFGSSTTDTIAEAIEALDQDTAVWIIDLRSNPGGDSNSTATSASLFTGGGVMLYFRDGQGNYNYTYTMPNFPDMTDKPLIILTSEHSASGSELFAGDIRSYRAGIALGQRTFGKGTAQIVLDETNCEFMVDGEAMKITAYRFFSPDGATNHIIGVLPTLLISPENTEGAAILLSQPEPSRAGGYLKLDISGQTFYIKTSQAVSAQYRAAFTELLESLPPSAVLYKGSGARTWEQIAPARLAKEQGLDFTARTFAGAADSEYARELDTLAVYGIAAGHPDGGLRPSDPITRSQFCALVATALGLPAKQAGRFTDVPDDAWYAASVHAMAELGFAGGYGDGRFGPDAPLRYQEMVTILSRVAAWASMDGYELDQQDLYIHELGKYLDYPAWAQAAARNLDELGALVEGPSPADVCTYEVAAASLCRLMERINLIWK